MTDKPTDDLLQRCRELLELNEKGESQQTALRALAATYDREITAHDRRAMAVSRTHLEAMRALLAATQQASTKIDELKSKLAFYEREREDQIRYLAAQSEEIIALLKQRIEQQLSDWNMPCAACSTPRACQYDGCRQDALTTQQPCGEVTDYVRVPARVVELLAIINRDGVIKRASELQEVYRLINAARAGEKQ